MGLETGIDYVSQLVDTNPTPSDPVNQGDDHIRIIKHTLLESFANVSGAVTASHTELNLTKTATNANTANELVKRDGSGNFTAGTITATTFVGTLTTAAQTNVTSVGALDGGSITSNFGNINIGTSDLTAGKAVIDDITVNGLNIGVTGVDEDLLLLGNNSLTVNGAITTTSAVSTGALDVTGNITVSGNVDGVDVADLNTKLSNAHTNLADARVTAILKAVYPVGSIYCSMTTTSPATLFGFGTWVAINGQILVGTGSSSDGTTTKSFALNTPQGSHSETLTENQLPVLDGSISIDAYIQGSGVFSRNGAGGAHFIDNTGATSANNSNRIDLDIGGGASHNNTPYVLPVSIWKRTF